jgi:3-oxoacyl-[acyl-carrier-protein] synthase-3
MHNAAIEITGSYVPENCIHNESLHQFSQAAQKMIALKTGVISRRHAGQSQCTSDLAYGAAARCLRRIGFPASKVEGIILATSSPDRIQPATATRLQHLLGAVNAFAFDINSVCSGSTYGIAMAQALIGSGMVSNILLVGAEVYSKLLNPQDFSTFPYFGDGAGAVFFHNNDSGTGVLHSILGSDGSGSGTICIPGGGTMLPFAAMADTRAAYFQMKGREVFDFAVRKGAETIAKLLEEAQLCSDDIRCIICHQANVQILLKIAENLGIDEEKFYMNMFRYGNTAGASVLIALDEALTRGIIGSGDLIVTAAFGGGLSWGANLIRL